MMKEDILEESVEDDDELGDRDCPDLETALDNCIPVHMLAAVLDPVFRVFAIYAMNLPEETYFDREDF